MLSQVGEMGDHPVWVLLSPVEELVARVDQVMIPQELEIDCPVLKQVFQFLD